MKRVFLTFVVFASIMSGNARDYNGYLQMLADFVPYMTANYLPMDTVNKSGEQMATFKGEDTFGNNEQGVRHNADLSMVCAFLCKYARGSVRLPHNVEWKQLKMMAMQSLVYAYSTHKANKLYPCKDGRYWGSVSKHDNSWESSLWAMSVAYSAFFQWKYLSEQQKQYIYRMLCAECNYELERNVPVGYEGDTKAEENGWECNVLAVTLALFPEDPLAPKWFDKLREFAINSYSHPNDRYDNKVIDPEYDNVTVAQLYRGANLYDDYTLQNHGYFHTSYQNVVIQELGEALLAMKLMQRELYGKELWRTNALMHNCNEVQNEVLDWLALADGELAMPNGNDWSLFLYDQLTSYATMACFMRDADALMLENQAARQIGLRQKTTTDGSWLLHADVGARRMGVEAHRVMMSWLMHECVSTDDLQPTSWNVFFSKYKGVKSFPAQDVHRLLTNKYFACFSWSRGLRNFTGYFAPTTERNNNIIVPFKFGNTGNLLGWYEVEGRRTNAVDVEHKVMTAASLGGKNVDSRPLLHLSGILMLCDSSLMQYYSLEFYDDCIVVADSVVAIKDVTVRKTHFGTLALSVDPFTRNKRTFDSNIGGITESSGKPFLRVRTNELKVDSLFSVITEGSDIMAFGGRQNYNSVDIALLHPCYDERERSIGKGCLVDRRKVRYVIMKP